MHGLVGYVQEGLENVPRKLCEFLLMFSTCFISLSVLLIFSSINYLFCLYVFFYSISSNIDELLSISPSANVFVFGDFNFHPKDWLTFSGGDDKLGELCYNFSILNDITQMANFPTQIPDFESHSPALLDFFLSSDASICSTMALLPFGNSDHVFFARMLCFMTQLMTILELIGMVFVII